MAELLQFKCPCCGGSVEFDGSTQKMKCPYCDAEFDVEAMSANNEEDTRDDNAEWELNCTDFSDEEAEGMRIYKCQSCGGEVVGDETTGATSCPYCGNPVVMHGTFSGELKPDVVIPFKIDKNAAKEAMKKHISNKKLLPKVFKDENHIDEIKGIYVPYWLFDCSAEGEAVYQGKKVKTWSDNNYTYKKTSHYRIERSGKLSFCALPVDGSTKMADDLMESIEPYNISDGVDFQTAYLSGYLADKYDVQSEDCLPRVNERIKNSLDKALRNTVNGYDTVSLKSSYMNLKDAKCRYALYPVWILNTSWNDQKFVFAVNGQTGKAVGDLPLDKSAFSKWLAILTAGIGVASYLIMTALNLF